MTPRKHAGENSIGVMMSRLDHVCGGIEDLLHMKRYLAIFPSVPDGHVIHYLRARFDPLATLVPPHLTLVFPFENNVSDDDLVCEIEQSIRGVKAFAVSLSGISGHENEYLFLNVKQGNDDLIGVHDRLYACSKLRPHRSLFHTFVPHMTVGRIADKAAFTDAVVAASAQDFRFDLEVSQITIETIGDNGSRFHAAIIDLA